MCNQYTLISLNFNYYNHVKRQHSKNKLHIYMYIYKGYSILAMKNIKSEF